MTTTVYIMKSDGSYARKVYPKRESRKIRGQELAQLKRDAEFWGCYSSGNKGSVYSMNLVATNEHIGDVPTTHSEGDYQKVAEFCKNHLGREPKAIYIY